MCTDKLKLRNDLTLDEINLLLAEEKNINVYRKLEYFKFKAMGFSKNESCELAGLKESSKYYLEKLWYLGGYNALVPHYGGGRDPKLTDEQLSELTDILNTKDKWIVNDVKKLIKEQFNVNYGYHGVRELLIRLNVDISNYFQEEAENKNKIHNVIENFKDISIDDKKEIENLIDKINEENSVYVIKKLIYILFRTIGFSNKVASNFLSITTGTGSNWLNAWNENNYEGLLRKPGQGRKSKLNEDEWNELKKN